MEEVEMDERTLEILIEIMQDVGNKLGGAINCTFRSWGFSGSKVFKGILTPLKAKLVYKGASL
jgi:hypothetical protein